MSLALVQILQYVDRRITERLLQFQRGASGAPTVTGSIPASLPPDGPAGGDLSGTYPNPTVQDDSHAHTPGTSIPAYPTSLPPTAHASTHQSGGGDAIKLDELGAPTDVTTLNVSTVAHGLAPKLPDDATQFLNGQGGWTTPQSGAPLTVKEADSAPSVSNVTEIRVTNGKLTDNGNGSVSLDLSSSAGVARELVTNGDPDNPEILFASGDIVMVEV